MKLIIILLLITCFPGKLKSQTKPVIGILANPHPINSENLDTAMVYETYVKWLNQSNADIVPILPWYTDAQIDELLNKVSGVLYMGGDRNVDLSKPWEIFAKKLFFKTLERNIPFWGTCQGFELIFAFLTNDINILDRFDGWELMLPITFGDNIEDSLIYSGYDNSDFEILRSKGFTVHYHNLGIKPEAFEEYSILKNHIRPTSFAFDKNGKKFINSVEGIGGKKIYGVQYHPEKDDINGNNALYDRLMKQMSKNFVDLARRVNNKLNDYDKVNWKLITEDRNPLIKEGYQIKVYSYENNIN